MKNPFSRLSKKATLALATVLAGTGIAAGASAWGPGRPTFTMQNPAPHVTFNSITDNPNYGDERTFFDGKDAANTNSGGYTDKVNVTDGKEMLLRVYVHNDASTNLNGANFDGKGVAKDAKVRIALPTATDNALRANAYVSASNANPGEVYDTVDFLGTSDFKLEYVPGSATMYTNAVPAGFKLNDSIVGSGASIGYQGANGTIPGCLQYSGIVTIKVKAVAAKYSIEKTVANVGDKTWSKSITAKAGSTVSYQLHFKNTGSTALNDVVVRDQLPAGVSLAAGSVKLFDTSYPNGTPLTDAVTKNGGQNIGSYTANAGAYVQFKAIMPTEDKLKCGENKFTNTGEARANGTAMTDTADVVINKTCANAPTYVCKDFDVTVDNASKTVTVSKYQTEVTGGATFNNVVINWGDGSAALTTNKPVGQTHTYTSDSFNITTTSHFTVDGKDVTAGGCAKSGSFTSTPPTTPTTPTTPEELPHTGAGQVFSLFGAVVVAGAVAHRLFSRRLSRR